MIRLALISALLLSVSCAPALVDGGAAAPLGPAAVDSATLMRDISVLADDSMQGRLVGTEGSARARRFLERRFTAIGLQPVGASGYRQDFEVSAAGSNIDTPVSRRPLQPRTL